MQNIGDDKNKSPAGGVAPHIMCANARQAIDFYKAAFGAVELYRVMHGDGHRVMYAHLSINGGSMMIHDDFPEFRGGSEAPAPAGCILHLQVDDADAWWERATAAGATFEMALANQPWGDRYGHLKDPYGHTWSIASPVIDAS